MSTGLQKMKGQAWPRNPWDTRQNFRLGDICDLIIQITLKFGINLRDSVVTILTASVHFSNHSFLQISGNKRVLYPHENSKPVGISIYWTYFILMSATERGNNQHMGETINTPIDGSSPAWHFSGNSQ